MSTFGESLLYGRRRVESVLMLLVNGKMKGMKIKGLKNSTHATRRDICLRFSVVGGGSSSSTPIPIILTHNW
ncbi:hypothetical protein TSUD_45260 [Trifolium subterraneum]|nr:hypothetical protein TSUD_45260 [Trifolium subterraneum]